MDENDVAPKRRILVVDDEEYITDLLSTSLRFQGFEVATAAAGFDALSTAASFNPELIMLDVNMPDIDGFEVCRRLRADGDLTPVIFLTAKDTKDDMLSGFTKGGDDYMTKPFSLEEVVARINAVLRRTGAAPAETRVHQYADLVMDEDSHRATRAGDVVDLSPTEWKLLRYLLMNAERVLSKSQILDHVWQYDFGGDASSVETYISYLRKKVDDVEPKLIHTVRGVGYTIRTEG
ncbi:MAG: response regulator transcription factor [Ilumatobacter sp.]